MAVRGGGLLLLPIACTSLLNMLDCVEHANEPSAWAIEFSDRLHALRAQTRAHRGRLTPADFLVHAADLLLWEVKLRLDRLLYPSRAGAAAMALHARLGRESALGGLGRDALRMIAGHLVQEEGMVPKRLSFS